MFQSYLSPIQTLFTIRYMVQSRKFQSYLSPIQTHFEHFSTLLHAKFQSYLSPIQTTQPDPDRHARQLRFNPILVQFKL